MDKPIWFPFYPGDFLASQKVTLMTTEEVGAYLLLLCFEWQDDECLLPNDDDLLKKLGRISGDIARIKACFVEKRGRLCNVRLYAEWEKVKHNKQIASKNASKRWHSVGNAPAYAEPMRNDSGGNAPAYAEPMRNACSSPSPSPPSSSSSSPSPSPSPSPPPPPKLRKKLRKNIRAVKDSARRDIEPKHTGVRTWEAYAEAYRQRYGVLPVRNQTVNSHLARLVDRLGQDDAPLVAAFYLTHNKPFYVQARHPTNLLLMNAEGLRTEWATGVKATTSEAKNLEQRDEAREQVKRVDALLKGGLA